MAIPPTLWCLKCDKEITKWEAFETFKIGGFSLRPPRPGQSKELSTKVKSRGSMHIALECHGEQNVIKVPVEETDKLIAKGGRIDCFDPTPTMQQIESTEDYGRPLLPCHAEVIEAGDIKDSAHREPRVIELTAEVEKTDPGIPDSATEISVEVLPPE